MTEKLLDGIMLGPLVGGWGAHCSKVLHSLDIRAFEMAVGDSCKDLSCAAAQVRAQ